MVLHHHFLFCTNPAGVWRKTEHSVWVEKSWEVGTKDGCRSKHFWLHKKTGQSEILFLIFCLIVWLLSNLLSNHFRSSWCLNSIVLQVQHDVIEVFAWFQIFYLILSNLEALDCVGNIPSHEAGVFVLVPELQPKLGFKGTKLTFCTAPTKDCQFILKTLETICI